MLICALAARRTRTLASGLAVGLAVLLGLIGAPNALAAIADIHSETGPLTDVYIGDNLTCQVAHTNDTSFEFYNPGSQAGHCETDVSVGSTGNGQLFQPGPGPRSASRPYRATGVHKARSR
ncbi:MAG: hypothetical protein ACXVH3_14785 [Solirubrobacteraceae bacterium]